VPCARACPCSGGPRKCVGDQFALMEAVVVLAVLLKKYDFELVPGREIGITTGATIHTSNGLYMYVKRRGSGAGSSQPQPAAAATAAA
jgi:carotene epsilon-monooxygenase